MTLLSRILVAVDGSAPSDAAVQLALRLAAPPRHDPVRFAAVFEREALIQNYVGSDLAGFGMSDVLQAPQAACASALEAAMAAARTVSVSATSILRTGLAVDAILDEARAWDASCIAIGTHGRNGLERVIFGSCAEGVLRKSPVPVLVVHAAPPDGARPFERILCAVDDSPAAQRAFDASVALASERAAELHVLAVVQVADEYASAYEVDGFDPDGSVSALYAQARATIDAVVGDARVERHVLGGADVAERIAQCAITQRCDVIALGTHGRGGIRRALLGSTAEGVLRLSTLPTLAFRDAADHALRAAAARTSSERYQPAPSG